MLCGGVCVCVVVCVLYSVCVYMLGVCVHTCMVYLYVFVMFVADGVVCDACHAVCSQNG